MASASEPASGSVRAKAVTSSPEAMRRRYLSRRAWFPKMPMPSASPQTSRTSACDDQASSSVTTHAANIPSPRPPYSTGICSPGSPDWRTISRTLEGMSSVSSISRSKGMSVSRTRSLVRDTLMPFEREIEETDDMPSRVREIVRQSGLPGLQIPVEYGGLGLGMFAACVVTEELAWSSQALVRLVCGDALGIGIFGNQALRDKYLRRIASGELVTAFALTEPDAGSDALAIRCRAEKKGSSYVLSGEKIMVTAGDIAGLVLVFAVTDPAAGPAGITAFIVDSAFEGFKVARVDPKMGPRGVHTASLWFDDCEVPEENVLGSEGEGFGLAMQLLDFGRIRYNGAASVGNAQRLLEMSVFYACL